MNAVLQTLVAPEPTNNFDAYRECAAEAATQHLAAWTFKRDPRYTRILEHVTPEQGIAHLAALRQEAPALWPKLLELLPEIAAENDALGQPGRERFASFGLRCSPANLRYLRQAVLLWQHVQRLAYPAVHVFELGGGYGGLALYAQRLAPLFATHLLSHTIIDVPEAGALQAAYAAALKLRIHTVNGLDAKALANALYFDLPWLPRFCFSAYAFSEFDAETRAWYAERLLCHCPHGLMVWNFARPVVDVAEKVLGGPVYPFVDAPLDVVPEHPGVDLEGLLVRW